MKYLLTLCFSLCLFIGCSKSDDGPYDPTNEQTLILYFPYSGLAGNIMTNLDELYEVWSHRIPAKHRILVYLSAYDKTHAELFDLTDWAREKNNPKPKKVIKSYTDPDFKTATGIATVLNDIKQVAPAKRYAMIVGCHGMGWVPAPVQQGKGVLKQFKQPEHKIYWDYTDEQGNPVARYFGTGGTTPANTHTDVTSLADAIGMAGLHMEYMLFDVCYMGCVEVAYALRHVTDNMLASVSEIPARGFPYLKMGHLLLGNPDYESICQEFGDFFKTYTMRPYATISLTKCSELEALAAIVKQIYAQTNTSASLNEIQYYDLVSYRSYFGYDTEFLYFDLSDYIHQVCTNQALLAAFNEQLKRTVPEACLQHTEKAIAGSSTIPIRTYSGIATSDPLTKEQCRDVVTTAWWQATH